MVGITTGLKLGGLAIAGVLGYTLIKNSGKIGSGIGGFFGQGLTDLGSGITSGFGEAFNIFGGKANAGVNGEDDINTDVDRIVQAGGIPKGDPDVAGFHPTSTPFRKFIESGAISQSFAEKFSFQPEVTTPHVLDVSNTFGFISRRAGHQGGTHHNFGGFLNAEAQDNALASAIEESASKYPEYFA